MSVRIVNMRWEKHPTFRCDRVSPLGNPFKLRDASEKERHRICNEYDRYFNENLNPDVAPGRFLEYLDQIIQAASKRDITIGCWCAPRRCHCQTIKDYVEREVKNAKRENGNP